MNLEDLGHHGFNYKYVVRTRGQTITKLKPRAVSCVENDVLII